MAQDNDYSPLREKADHHKKSFKQILLRYLHYWYWFMISLVLVLLGAYLYNRYTPRVYSASSQIKILTTNENNLDLQGLSGGSSMFKESRKLKNEVAIIRSRKIMDSVVRRAHLQTVFFREGDILTLEAWQENVPIKIAWASDSRHSSSPRFSIDFNSDTSFTLEIENEDGFSEKAVLNDTIEVEGFKFSVELNPDYRQSYKLKDKHLLFQHIGRKAAINHILGNLSIDQTIENSDVLTLTYSGSNKSKIVAILDAVVREFYLSGLRDKEAVSKHSATFIDRRIGLIEDDLDTVENSLVDYKQQSGLMNIASITGQETGKESEASRNSHELRTQKTIAQDFINELSQGQKYELLPANMGLKNNSVNNLINSYNEAVSIRKNLLVSSTEKNPLVKNSEDKLDRVKKNILASLQNYIRSLNQSLESFSSRERSASSRIYRLPENEKMLRSIQRQQKIKEELYLFLLKKREEIGLEYAMISPSVKIVDQAYLVPGAISPKTRMIYTFAVIIGLFLPFSILYLKFLFYNKVDTSEDVENALPNTPILGEIPQIKGSEPKIVTPNDQSSLAESFRILRTNLNFSMPESKQAKGHVVFITSTAKGEGKTFASFNLSQTLALTNHKILLIGADLRNPKTHTFYNLDKNTHGLSNYLVDSSVTLESIVHRDLGKIKNLDLITSGKIPPNPSELLMRDRFGDLISIAQEKYDYIIVDTAPTKVVTDSLLISQYADLTLYLVRAGVTDKRLLKHINDMRKSKKLKHVGVVLNGMSFKAEYGYKYNYGYGSEQPSPWWKFWKS